MYTINKETSLPKHKRYQDVDIWGKLIDKISQKLFIDGDTIHTSKYLHRGTIYHITDEQCDWIK